MRSSATERRPTAGFLLGLLLVPVAVVASSGRGAEPGKAKIGFNRQVRPVFANNCYACHGPDSGKRMADLRLDVREVAVRSAIVPGKASASPLVRRVTSTDADEQMPPPMSETAAAAPGSGRGDPAVDRRGGEIRGPLGARPRPDGRMSPRCGRPTGRGAPSTDSSPPATRSMASGRRPMPTPARSCGDCDST